MDLGSLADISMSLRTSEFVCWTDDFLFLDFFGISGGLPSFFVVNSLSGLSRADVGSLLPLLRAFWGLRPLARGDVVSASVTMTCVASVVVQFTACQGRGCCRSCAGRGGASPAVAWLSFLSENA